MAGRGVVEDLGEGAPEVLVVVEDLVVVAGGAGVALGEDLVGGVDHDLPDVGVGQERLEGPVAGEVAPGPLGDAGGVGQVVGAEAALDVFGPATDLLVEEGSQGGPAVGAGHVEGQGLGPLLDGPLDLQQRRPPCRGVGGGVPHPVSLLSSPSSEAVRAASGKPPTSSPTFASVVGTGSLPDRAAGALGNVLLHIPYRCNAFHHSQPSAGGEGRRIDPWQPRSVRRLVARHSRAGLRARAVRPLRARADCDRLLSATLVEHARVPWRRVGWGRRSVPGGSDPTPPRWASFPATGRAYPLRW